MIGSIFRNNNRFFDFSFKNGNNYTMRDFLDRDYMLLVEIKDFNALIDNKQFFDELVETKQGACEKPIEMSKNDDYTKGKLLYHSYHQNYHKPIGTDLSRQANTSFLRQINFTRKLEEGNDAIMHFIAGKNKKSYFRIFSLLNVTQ